MDTRRDMPSDCPWGGKFRRGQKDQAFHVVYHERKYDGSSSSKFPKYNFKNDVAKSRGKEKEVQQSSAENLCNFCKKRPLQEKIVMTSSNG
jgi:hypothetical protein